MTAQNTVNNQVKFSLLAGIDADKCPADSRFVKIIYKEDKKTKEKKNSLGAFVGKLAVADIEELCSNATVKEWITDKLYQVQDQLIRSALEGGDSITVPSAGDIKAAIVKEQENSGTRERLSADSIKKWVIESGLADTLAITFSTRLSIDKSSPKISAIVAAYSDNISLLAGKTPLPETVMVNIIKAIDLAPPSGMVDKLLNRVEILTPISLDGDEFAL